MRRTFMALAVLTASLAVVTPAGAGGGGCHSPATSDATSTVPIENLCFAPTVTEVAVGETVTWVNNDAMQHDVAAVGGAWGSAALDQGDEFSQTFDAPGVYVYVCRFHSGMAGAVDVVDDAQPIAAVTTPGAENGDGPGLAGAAIVIFVLLASIGGVGGLLLTPRRDRQLSCD